jgi:hypothetical protein
MYRLRLSQIMKIQVEEIKKTVLQKYLIALLCAPCVCLCVF